MSFETDSKWFYAQREDGTAFLRWETKAGKVLMAFDVQLDLQEGEAIAAMLNLGRRYMAEMVKKEGLR